MKRLEKTKILDVGITNATIENILEEVWAIIKNGDTKHYIVTPNPEILVHAARHPSFKKILNEAEISLPDGIGVFIAGGILGHKFKERIPGIDFIEEVCKWCENYPVSIGFLGAEPGIAERTAERLLDEYPYLQINFINDTWSEAGFSHAQKLMKEKGQPYAALHNEHIDLLFVAYGFPKQEEWVVSHLEKLPVKMAMGVGGAFDYISGNIIRAPYLVRAMGMEWFFRLVRQPWRIKRQLALPLFVYLVLKQKFAQK
jgi:N-acetylglucosaminyldiphosphoundecaprenol N-acetyl-beta-D-mannosaminyltransferase